LEIKSKNFCIVLSSPSGAGKTSISKKLLQKDRKLALSISCTTRPRRKGEVNKKDYIFISPFLFGLVVQDMDKDILLSLCNNFFEIEVFPAPEGEDKTIQKFLLLISKY